MLENIQKLEVKSIKGTQELIEAITALKNYSPTNKENFNPASSISFISESLEALPQDELTESEQLVINTCRQAIEMYKQDDTNAITHNEDFLEPVKNDCNGNDHYQISLTFKSGSDEVVMDGTYVIYRDFDIYSILPAENANITRNNVIIDAEYAVEAHEKIAEKMLLDDCSLPLFVEPKRISNAKETLALNKISALKLLKAMQ